MDLSNFRIHVTEHAIRHLGENQYEDDFLTHIKAELVVDSENAKFDVVERTEREHEITVGDLSGYRIKINAMTEARCNYPEGIYDLADQESQDLSDIFEALLHRGHLEVSGDIIVVDRVTVRERFRGQDLGLLLIETVLKNYDYEFAALLTAPTDHFDMSLTQARRKLRNHYSRLGFQQVGRTQVMTLHHSQRRDPMLPKVRRTGGPHVDPGSNDVVKNQNPIRRSPKRHSERQKPNG